MCQFRKQQTTDDPYSCKLVLARFCSFRATFSGKGNHMLGNRIPGCLFEVDPVTSHSKGALKKLDKDLCVALIPACTCTCTLPDHRQELLEFELETEQMV